MNLVFLKCALCRLLLHFCAAYAVFDGQEQARREPQRGPGKHYRGALSPPILYVLRSRKRGEGCPLTIRLRVRGSVVSSPSGVRGRATAENGFYAYFWSQRSHLEHHFQYYWDGGPPKCCGAWENSPPSQRAWSRIIDHLHNWVWTIS